MSTVVNRIAVIAPNKEAFFSLMKNYNISMYSNARNKFWTHKGATEYFLLNEETQLRGTTVNEVLMLSGCSNQWSLYNSACESVLFGGPMATTQAQIDAEIAVEEALVKIVALESAPKDTE
jgi:hypothetical protein